jgi:hypothetical protein
VGQLESLKTVTYLGLLPHHIKDRVNKLSSYDSESKTIWQEFNSNYLSKACDQQSK